MNNAGQAAHHQTRKRCCDFHLSLKVPRKGGAWYGVGDGLKKGSGAQSWGSRLPGAPPPKVACSLAHGDRSQGPLPLPPWPQLSGSQELREAQTAS